MKKAWLATAPWLFGAAFIPACLIVLAIARKVGHR